jgi:hypothetical protein
MLTKYLYIEIIYIDKEKEPPGRPTTLPGGF